VFCCFSDGDRRVYEAVLGELAPAPAVAAGARRPPER